MKLVFGAKRASTLTYWLSQPGNRDKAVELMRVPTWSWPHECPAKSHQELTEAIERFN